MAKRLLVTGAGTGASHNLIRGLRAGDGAFDVVGCHHDRFVLKTSPADRNYLLAPPGEPGFLEGLRHVIEREKIDLLIPTSDQDVRICAEAREALPCRVFLPERAVIDRCQDKYDLTVFLRSRGIPAPETYPIDGLDCVERVFTRLAHHSMLWCRVRSGWGSAAALPVRTPGQAGAWIAYWEEMRGVPAASFTLSEYLPGRDFFAQSLWSNGEPILLKTCERLSYFVGGGNASGISSASALAKTVREPRVAEVCAAAIRALDPAASGTFNFDLRENREGVPCITEINAGRFPTASGLLDRAGKHNMALTYVRVALGETIELHDEYDALPDYYSVRDLDTVPGIFVADDFFDGIEDVRALARPVARRG